MPSAQTLRKQIEATLAAKVPAALTPAARTVRPGLLSGISAVDGLLHCGVAEGAITELVGEEGSGRTSLALAYLAALARTDTVCAWVDVADALCIESVAANGMDLERLLWVRCGQPRLQSFAPPRPSAPSRVEACNTQPRHTGGGSPHPRSEGRDMPQAIGNLLQAHGGLLDHQLRRERKMIGTPGAPNRPLDKRPSPREEQVNSDRLPPRRGDNLAIAPRCAEPQPRRVPQVASSERMLLQKASAQNASHVRSPWPALDQAIRTTDLLLQGGGFGAIVLDLGSTPPEIAWRIPLATWFRFRAACERSRTSLVLLTQHPCARSSAELVVRLETGAMEAQTRVMTGIRYRAAIDRSRSEERAARVIPIRKPMQRERPGQWTSHAAWGPPG
ncbi:recombination protein RecA [Granulicella aggregans]|uniref:Recombination protein RecA n=1 Tax=Granulicella aggregans TaxID=474949 RepID=A0A7W7ZA77_9BACT|nr:recombinase RecA [Granulicella aggregans]MBB5055616.1 recombination protein RecA [Granulicella aggregans]